MVSDRALQYVNDPGPASMIVDRAEDGSGLEGEHSHAKFPSSHALDFRPEVNRRKKLRRNTIRLR